ncbi:D-alanyl-D-alanine carboxypeptidase family protein (macronuclear) [Tetrahymena thermophila SB210]|uniref:D-alanyl-D-alanine carboxypeptidase family protein n=1 Tax=Tetrahymena thermophila (strain SB210) TaxID=312017 RepID=I7ME29_TETTS|nr:D-alanyl-D-alanine carboxypeptidase family protein [Tetrahymena thermophila SB210]EAR94141.2 D-alanyl-D-alanine carboxypeptidase family protein [Tetrahymena thermophila SB210]|eukprot:XP_001014386.2 D-alanyl-D-alanine carboxypeptidase family protein [Tetrahymena thermophila SB210]
MNYFQNSSINNFYPLMQRSNINKFVQPQLVCVDQSNMNVTATALNTIKNSTSQKFQRGSRQYIIKFRNSNASAISTSQSPQKRNKNQLKQELNNHLSNPYQKENKNLTEISIKAQKIVTKVVSPSSSVSTQSSNKNDLPATDKDDDSPMRLNNQDQIKKIIQFQNDSVGQKASQKAISNYPKNDSRISSKIQNKQQNDSQSPNRSKSNESKNMQFFQDNSNQALQEAVDQDKSKQRNVMRDSNTFLIKPSNQNYDSKAVNIVDYQKILDNSSEINQQILPITTRNRDGSAPPLNAISQNSKALESDKKNTKDTLSQTQQPMQKRHSILRLSDPQSIVNTLYNDLNLGKKNSKNEQDLQQKQSQQQSDRYLLSTTFSQIQFNDNIKKQITQKQTKKNSSFLCSKRKKFKKSKNHINLQEIPLQAKTSQNTQILSNQEEKFEQYDQDFQTLADQLENQQLHMKIVGNEYLLDDDNAYSEEYLDEDEEINKEFIQQQMKDNKKVKINNSVILPSLVQISSNNIVDDQLEQKFKSKELSSLNLTAKSVCIFDVEKNKPILCLKGKKPREVASLTKIMTCYIICQAIQKKKIKQTEQIKVSRAAASMIGTSAYLRSGDQLSVWDLLHGLMLPSGNDAAFALAEYMGRILFFEDNDYKEQLQQNPNSFENCKAKDAIKCFLKEMNRVAKDLKLANTKYSNPHGLVNKSNRSSALDICKLSAHCLTKSQLFRQIVKTKQYTCQVRNKQGSIRIASWENTNKCLLRYNTICDGVKTGVTCTAGPCLTTSWRVKDRHFIITILKCDSLELRYSESQRVFAWICEKLGIELSAEEKMPYEKVKQLYKRNSVESIQSMKESCSNNSLSSKQNSNLILQKSDSLLKMQN